MKWMQFLAPLWWFGQLLGIIFEKNHYCEAQYGQFSPEPLIKGPKCGKVFFEKGCVLLPGVPCPFQGVPDASRGSVLLPGISCPFKRVPASSRVSLLLPGDPCRLQGVIDTSREPLLPKGGLCQSESVPAAPRGGRDPLGVAGTPWKWQGPLWSGKGSLKVSGTLCK